MKIHQTNTPNAIYTDVPASEGKGLHIQSTSAGKFTTLVIPYVKAGDYLFNVNVKKWNNRGIVNMSIAEKPEGPYKTICNSFDQYNKEGIYMDSDIFPISFLSEGPKYLKFDIIGKNTLSSNYWVLLDYIKLIPIMNEEEDNIVSIQNNSEQSIYPIISENSVFTTSDIGSKISLYNACGKLILEKKAIDNLTEIIVNNNGLYIINLSINGRSKIFKIIKY